MSNLQILPTYRNKKDDSGLPLQKVGIRNVQAPFNIITKYQELIPTIGRWSVYTDLSPKFKGISMSLIQRTLFRTIENNINIITLLDIAKAIKRKSESEAQSVYVKVDFPYTINTYTPQSRISVPRCYKCSLEVQLVGNIIRKFLTVTTQHLSLCPCSLELAKYLELTTNKKSGGHQQRGFAEVTIEFDNFFWIEDLVQLIERSLKAIPYPSARKEDEMFICKTAFDNPMFVEEAARKVGLTLNNIPDIKDFVIIITHQESIHPSDAVAVLRKKEHGGLK